MPAAIASRYARALVDVVLAPSSQTDAERVRQDLRAFEQALAGSPELRNALESPAVKKARKRAVIEKIAEALQLSGVTRNFLLVLIDHRRTGQLSGVVTAFETMVDERLGRLQVEVASARGLQEQLQTALIRQLETITGKQVRLKLTIDDELVGGLVLRLGSTVYDGSVRGRLEALGRQLLAEKKGNYGSNRSRRDIARTSRRD